MEYSFLNQKKGVMTFRMACFGVVPDCCTIHHTGNYSLREKRNYDLPSLIIKHVNCVSIVIILLQMNIESVKTVFQSLHVC